MSRISTHVLDTALGRPAAGMMVSLEYAEPSGEWQSARRAWRPMAMAGARTFCPGRIALYSRDNTGCDSRPEPTTWRNRSKGLYLMVEIVVTVRPGDTHLHVPLLLSPNGYTTYRGASR